MLVRTYASARLKQTNDSVRGAGIHVLRPGVINNRVD